MKVAVVPGHTKFRKGAYCPYLGVYEWDYNKGVAENLKDVASIFYYDSYNMGYTSMVKRLAREINKQKYDLILILHFNAAANKQANGCEALYYSNNERAKELAEYFCGLMKDRFKLKNRGAKALKNKHQRGFAAVYYTNATTLILEPFFGSNERDSNKMNWSEGIDNYIKVIKDVITNFREGYER